MRADIPGYAAAEDAEREIWMDDDQALFYPRMGTLVRFLTEAAEAGNWAPMQLALDYAEAHIDHDDTFTRELLLVGLLEDLQNTNLWRTDPSLVNEVPPMLGPVCRREWDALIAFWEGRAP